MRIRIRAPTMSGREPDCRDTSTRQQYKAAKIYTMLGQQVLLLRILDNKCNKSTRQPTSPRGPRARQPHPARIENPIKPMHFLADSAPRAPWGRAPLLRPHPASGTARATRFPALAIQDGSGPPRIPKSARLRRTCRRPLAQTAVHPGGAHWHASRPHRGSSRRPERHYRPPDVADDVAHHSAALVRAALSPPIGR